MILTGRTIRRRRILHPCSERARVGTVSHGLGPSGYDVRIEFDSKGQQTIKVVEPGEFFLASTIERFTMPLDVVGIVHDKSTWVRQGLTVQNTVIEPGWDGWLTLELLNHSKAPLTLERGVGIAQVVFHRTDLTIREALFGLFTGYSGKYQNQERGPQKAR